MRTKITKITLAAIFLLPSAAIAEENAAAKQLIDTAITESLAEGREWRALLHFHQPRFRKATTYVDDPSFFLAENGATDAAAELVATLQAFVDEPASRCRFPARYNWLSSVLDMSAWPVSDQVCTDYLEWRANIDASKVVLVFAASYLNSPSSRSS